MAILMQPEKRKQSCENAQSLWYGTTAHPGVVLQAIFECCSPNVSVREKAFSWIFMDETGDFEMVCRDFAGKEPQSVRDAAEYYMYLDKKYGYLFRESRMERLKRLQRLEEQND
ncbi:MAG: hypothetical protein GY841_16400 [FCB group bacterium]|nr:hypothetical protein [FCB group bacterium]